MTRNNLILLFILLLPVKSFSQISYISTDSSKKSGVVIIDEGPVENAKFCHYKQGQKIILYSPAEIKEYGIKNGPVYVSLEIPVNGKFEKVFLQKVVDGKVNLYQYTSINSTRFFVDSGQEDLVEISKMPEGASSGDYKSKLAELYSDCPSAKVFAKRTSFNLTSLSRSVTRYNEYGIKSYPYLSYGPVVGFNGTKLFFESPVKSYDRLLTLPDKSKIPLNMVNYKMESGIAAGIFINKPFWDSKFSLQTEIIYTSASFSYYDKIDDKRLSFDAKMTSMNIPVMARYSFDTGSLKPFLDAGICYSHNFSNTNKFVDITVDTNEKTLAASYSYDHLSSNLIGYCFGGGIKMDMNSGHYVFLELRHTRMYGQYQINSLFEAETMIAVGFGF
ncbi:MAG: PorT family protein [Bacteroidales bacterium]|nr:PorT family protein [Bacteroidales bacterium]